MTPAELSEILRTGEGWWKWVVFALAAKVLVDAVQAGKLTYEQWDVHKAFCF